ncbi:hypothetical protein AN189_18025 [Loktanella sp. 3ANDIMAR09]|uniref:hypothetical protein n=1 Tax=Loktanella sp. 3ANDIMAR09 TaxID=1225657 RepID=UPI0006F64BDB|nr:hypothetical protein [Loktanella sp. 3ANDIMAR09]KQI66954.1 hypothetical protein AN189_18025 [Loktanella sp. 3ANDIMAR09]
MTVPALSIAANFDDLREYPIPADERLQSHYFLQLEFRRWLSSETRLLASWEMRGVILELFMIAQDQTPVGTLPVNPKLLARLLGVTDQQWAIWMQADVNPLRHWVECRAGDQVRLMHPVVTERALAAIGQRRDREAEQQRRREAKQRKDLEQRLKAMDGMGRLASSPQMVDRIDAWLRENCTGNRTESAIREAVDAVSMRS